ncbi:MAG: iron-containing alcohol dehydrogenase [Caldimonas sp.]
MALINYITQVQLDFGALALLSQELERAGIKKPLVVTDAGVRAAGLLDRTLAALGGRAYAVFDATPSNPTERAVRAAAEVYNGQGCDGLVAVGGGSSIDLAKGVAIAATHPGPLTTYATIEGGSARISERVAPLIAIPTTAGTGSEVARGAIVIVDDGRKLGFHSWHLVPKTAICDPDLTLGLPPFLTAATGMDAIAHCMETFMAPAVNPPADGIALDGLERAWANIERATRDGSDREARFNMMSASMQGAMAFQKGLGCVHSLSHSLGGANPKLHHGTLNAMFLPAVVEFNASAPGIVKERRLERMAHAMGIAVGAGGAAEAVAEAIRAMNRRLGLPSGLAELGVGDAMYERIIDGAMADHTHKTNPRLATRDDYARMLEESM